MPNEESVLVLMAKTAMDKTAYRRTLFGIDTDKELFPEEELNFLDLLHNKCGTLPEVSRRLKLFRDLDTKMKNRNRSKY